MTLDRPWKSSYPAPASWDTPIETGPVYAVLDASVARFADHPAIETSGKRATYAEFATLVDRAAKGFQEIGVGPGVHVGLYVPNTPHYLVAFFGILKAGGTVVNYSPLDAEQVLRHKIEDSDTQIVVTLDLPILLPVMEKLWGTKPLRTLVVGSGVADHAAFPAFAIAPDAPREPVDAITPRLSFARLLANDGAYVPQPFGDPADTVAVIQYTGGTTGLPKGAILTHANLTAAFNQYAESVRVEPPVIVEGVERTILVLPLFHIYALTSVMLLSIKLGSELILHPRFDADAILRDLDKKATAFYGVPTMYAALVNHPKITEVDLSALKYCASGGAPLPLEIHARFRELTGIDISEGWGMTETSPSGTFTPIAGLRKPGSCGIPVPGADIRFVSVGDPSAYVGRGERGEIVIAGPNVMKGYWKNEAASRESLTPDGYFRTGDVGYMDDDGFIFIVDRIKDMMLCGGFNVYPRNIEEAIYQHPSVAEVSVIGVPDGYRGETPKAFVTLRKDHAAFTLDELKAFLADKIGKHEMVAQLEFRETLPKTAVGKIQKTVLVEEEARKRAGVV